MPVTLSFPPHRSVKASHILISTDGKVCLSGLRSNLSMISHGRRQRAVHDFPKYSIKVLPWLSPEVLQQVCVCKEPLDFPGNVRVGAPPVSGKRILEGRDLVGQLCRSTQHAHYLPASDV